MKKLNKFFAILVALAMMATLCVSMAFAETPASAEAYLTKTLTKPNGLSGYNTSYSMTMVQTIEATDTDGYVDTAATITSPITVNANVDKSPADEGSLVGKSGNIFAGAEFEAPGTYEFTVAEVFPTAATYTDQGYAVDPEDSNKFTKDNVTVTLDATNKTVTIVTVGEKKTTTEVYDYSAAVYKVYAGVASYEDATGTHYYIESIAVKDENGEKVPFGEPGDGEENGFNFENKYNKTVETTPTGVTEDEDGDEDKDGSSLYIEKEVTIKAGTEGTIDTDKEFRMTVSVTFPTNATMDEYTAIVVDAAGDPVAGKSYIFDADNLTQAISIRHTDRIVFTEIEYGAKYTVSEDAYPGYETKSGEVTTAELITDSDSNGTKIVNEYDKDKDPATGLSISNLPFIVLALVAIGGLVAYVVVRRKSEDNA